MSSKMLCWRLTVSSQVCQAALTYAQPQMCRGRTVENLLDAELWSGVCRFSKRRRPLPKNTGDKAISNSSTASRLRYC